MNTCRNRDCQRPATLFLCEDCINQLDDMLEQIPWLLDELDARIQKLDRISAGTVGRTRRPETLSVMDFDAAETSREVRKTLLHWVTNIAQTHTSRTPPALTTVQTKHLAQWLRVNIKHIARDQRAGSLYHDIDRMVGTKPNAEDSGHLVTAINRTDRTYYGPCTANIGKNRDGTPRQCGHDLYAPTESTSVTCGHCKVTTDAKKQLISTITARDLVTEPKLLEAMAALGEPISRDRLYTWITAKQLTPRGWIHAGRIIPHKIRHKDPRVFSLSQARQLRWRDEANKEKTHA